jgi:Holliday junction DNA helicase RuvB
MLEQFTGQREAIAPLLLAIAACERTGRPLPNALFLGGPGRGKTTLAKAVAEDLGVPFVTLHGSSVVERGAIADKIAEAKGGILFIDEIHRLPVQIAEDLYRVIDEGKLAVSIPKMETVWKEQAIWFDEWAALPVNARWLWSGPGFYKVEVAGQRKTRDTETKLIDVSPITVLGATTDEALLPEPFFSRLSSLIVHLRPYSIEELADIAQTHAIELGLTLQRDSALIVASRSRSTPRLVKQLVERMVDWAVALPDEHRITEGITLKVMDMLGIDQYGLSQPHRDILDILRKSDRGLSRTSLAQQLRIPPRNVEQYWGALSETGFVTIDTRHKITEEGRNAYA